MNSFSSGSHSLLSSSTPRAAGSSHAATENGGTRGAEAFAPSSNGNDAVDVGTDASIPSKRPPLDEENDREDPEAFLASLALDPFTSPLLDPRFDPAAAAGAELAAAQDERRPREVASALRAVAARASAASAALVSSKRSELSLPLQALDSADSALRGAAAPAAALRAGLARARRGVSAPVEELERRATALARAHAAAEVLRAARRRCASSAALEAALGSESGDVDLPALARAVADAKEAIEGWPRPSCSRELAVGYLDGDDEESDPSPPRPASATTNEDSSCLLLPSLEASCGEGGPQGVAAAEREARQRAREALSAALGGDGKGGGTSGGGEALAAAGDALLALSWLGDARSAAEDEVRRGAEAAAAPLRRAVAEAEARAGGGRRGGGAERGGDAVASRLDASSLWEAAAASFAALARGASRARLLDEAARARRDPRTHERLAASAVAFGGGSGGGESETALRRYWHEAPREVASALEAAVAASSSASSASPLVAAYPRLAALFDEAFASAAAATATAAASPGAPPSASSSSSAAVTPATARAAAATVLPPARDRWASTAAGIAVEAATAAFGGKSASPSSLPSAPLPTSADVQRLVARLHDVLTDAGGAASTTQGGGSPFFGSGSDGGGPFSAATAELSPLAASATAAGVATAAVRVLAMAGVAADPPEGSDGLAAERGVALSAAAVELHRSLSALLSPRRGGGSDPSSSSPSPLPPAPLAAALDALQASAAWAAAPAFSACARNGAAALEKMHDGSDDRDGAVGSPLSAWAVDLGNCLAHFRGSTLSRLGVPQAVGGGGSESGGGEATAAAAALPSSVAAALSSRLAARLALLAVRNACVVELPEEEQQQTSTATAAADASPSSSSRVRLAADLAHVDASISESLGGPPPAAAVVRAGAEASAVAAGKESKKSKRSASGVPRYYSSLDAGAALRAARKLLLVPTWQLFSSSEVTSAIQRRQQQLALLRSIPAPERALWLLSRCPPAVPRLEREPVLLARLLDDSRAVLLGGGEAGNASLAERIRVSLRDAGSAPELEEGWSLLKKEIEAALSELEGAAEELRRQQAESSEA